MRDEIDPAYIAKLSQHLTTYLNDDLHQAARNTAYAALRADVINDVFDFGTLPLNVARLAAEFAIQDAQHAAVSGISKSQSDHDAWSLLDPTSPHYVLNAQTVAPDVFPYTAQKHTRPSAGIRSLSRHITTILSMWLHGLNRDASMDRIGYVWLVLDPLIQILVICVIPVLIQPDYLYDMAIFPFAVIGACFWLAFRTAAIGAIAGGGVLKQQLEHPSIRRFDIIVARSVNAFVNYFVAGFVLLSISIFTQLTDGPQNFPVLMLCFATVWVMGISFGIIANSLIGLYPGLSRIIIYSLRFIALMSGLFYAPEQLPEWVAEIFLYNPLLQVIQLARSAWFFEYTTMDANIVYIMFWAASLIFLALICLRADESRLETVRA